MTYIMGMAHTHNTRNIIAIRRIDRDGNAYDQRGRIVGHITRTDTGWTHDLASDVFPTQSAARRSLFRILNPGVAV